MTMQSRLFYTSLIEWMGLLFIGVFFCSAAAQPFDVAVEPLSEDARQIKVSIKIEPGHYIYADSFVVRSEDGVAWRAIQQLPLRKHFDPILGEEKEVFAHGFEAVYEWPGSSTPRQVEVEWQGCDREKCFFPEKRVFELAAGSVDTRPRASADVAETSWQDKAAKFLVVAKSVGYQNKDAFLQFLQSAETREGQASRSDMEQLVSSRPLMAVFLILLGGFALNLTPCVLPMIPVNLAIIGAGVRRASRRQGFLLGLAYGIGIALAYGSVGLVAVLTGGTFGALNASPWFNLSVALIFLFLSLAAFEVIPIDLSRLQSRIETNRLLAVGSRYAAAILLGALSAVLAGACVAPVVIAVLVLAGSLWAQGYKLALGLPFLLGIGMALPWPFAGAGLAMLPRPGAWMKWVSRLLGAGILLLAAYYGHVAWRLFRSVSPDSGQLISGTVGARNYSDENAKLRDSLDRALRENRPVLIDFWASWCKNCIAMEKTTFRHPDVVSRLQSFVVIKYQAEHPNALGTREVLEHFGVGGLPTYVILQPMLDRHATE